MKAVKKWPTVQRKKAARDQLEAIHRQQTHPAHTYAAARSSRRLRANPHLIDEMAKRQNNLEDGL